VLREASGNNRWKTEMVIWVIKISVDFGEECRNVHTCIELSLVPIKLTPNRTNAVTSHPRRQYNMLLCSFARGRGILDYFLGCLFTLLTCTLRKGNYISVRMRVRATTGMLRR
jgi:hypothetical protein